jgi:Domain of Unknown Function with PDB structure (DUF3861)
MSYRYRITIEKLGPLQSHRQEEESLQFCADNHDPLLEIVKAVQAKRLLDMDRSASLAIGLKLLGEIVLAKRKDPLFAPLVLPIRNFTQQLKSLEPVSHTTKP